MIKFILLSAIVVTVTFFLRWYLRRRRCLAPLKLFPGIRPTFLIGNVGSILTVYSKTRDYHPGVYIAQRLAGFAFLNRKFGLYSFWFGITPIVNIFRADIMEKILSSSTSLEKSFHYSFLHKWLGTGLLTSDGAKWKSRRKLLTPAFHFRILEDFLPVFNDQSWILVKKLKSLCHQEFIDITPLITLCTLDMVCETAMGVSIGAQDGSNSEYVQTLHNLGYSFNQRSVRPWLWNDFLFGLTSVGRGFNKDVKTLHNFTQKVIKEKKEKLFSKTTSQDSAASDDNFLSRKKKAFMDLLLDLHVNGQNLSEDDIREEVDTFMFEGHDTTAVGLLFALYLIGLHSEVQKKITEELDDIFGQDTDRSVTYDDIRNMKYLECCLKESQRLFPSVPFIGRKLNEEVHHEGLTIPKGTTVNCGIYTLHMDAEVFPNPEIFNPDRFEANISLNRHPYAYVPFSAGPRNCIGQKFAMLEEKTVICNILRHFRIISLDPRDQFHVRIEFTLRPSQPVRLKFIPRS